MPSREPGKYLFRLIDGNASGKPSLNGFTVNGQRCSVRDLQDGDQITFGGTIDVSYEVRPAHNITMEDTRKTLASHDGEEELNTILAEEPTRVGLRG